LALAGLSARVDDDDVALFKVVYESMQVLEVETAAGVIAALGVKNEGRSIA
jgi:hypothetical protein